MVAAWGASCRPLHHARRFAVLGFLPAYTAVYAVVSGEVWSPFPLSVALQVARHCTLPVKYVHGPGGIGLAMALWRCGMNRAPSVG